MSVIRCLLFLSITISLVFSYSLKQTEEAKFQLQEYIDNKKTEINDRFRLLYHIAGPVGWINDPNGFIYYKGEFHLFFQFYPYDSVWGPMHWGHVSGPDLVQWKELPTALLPEEEQCFSGSAVTDGDNLILMYTGHLETKTEPFYNEKQYLAFSDDGINFYKYDGNPVLSMTPNDSPDFRDPKVWKYGDYWYVILGSKTVDDRGRVLLYRSENFINWEFLNVLGESNGDLGYMWECPDFFELDGKFVLLMSPQGVEPQGDRYKNTHQTGYIIGNFNYETFEFVPETEFQELDFGHDFYASQTTEHDGKRYVVAWFSMWEVPHPEEVDGWAGAMTLIRELSLVGTKLFMKPLEAMTNLRNKLLVQTDNFKQYETIEFGKAAELLIRSNLTEKLLLELKGSEIRGELFISWNPEDKKVSVSRDGDVRQVEWDANIDLQWRIFLDASSLELFCGEGEVVFSTRAYPEGGWKLSNLGSGSLELIVYDLNKSIL